MQSIFIIEIDSDRQQGTDQLDNQVDEKPEHLTSKSNDLQDSDNTSTESKICEKEADLKSSRTLSVQDVVLVLAGFLINMFPQGLGNSYGVVYTHLKSMEALTDYQVSWIGSLMTGILGVGAIIGSQLINMVGCRLTSVLGGVLISLGLVISAMVTNINVLYVSLGVMPGIGAAFGQLAAIVCLTQHFEKGRPLAVGILSTGGAVGMLTFPLLWSLVLERCGWQGAMLVVGGIALNVIWLSLFLRSPPQTGKEGKIEEKENRIHIYTSHLRKPSFILLLINAFFGGLSMFIFGSYIPEYANITLPEVTSTGIAIIVCAMGAGSVIGRVLFSSLSMASPKAPLILYTSTLTMCGLSDAAVAFCNTYATHIINSASQGAFLGGWTTVISLVTANLYGSKHLPITLGMVFLLQGLGCMVGPPVASALVGLANRTDILFFFAAAGYLVSAVCTLPLFRVQHYNAEDITMKIKAKRRSTAGQINLAFVEGG